MFFDPDGGEPFSLPRNTAKRARVVKECKRA
jgi:hypothetical protein